MTFKPGVFTSNTVCTAADLELERAINKKLPHGKVTLYTIREPHGDQYGMIYSFRGSSKSFTRRSFELDTAELVDNLAITALGMENTKISSRWTYDEDDTNPMPQWLIDQINDPLE